MADRVLVKTEVKIMDYVQTPGGIGRVVGFIHREGSTYVIINHSTRSGTRADDLAKIIYYLPVDVEVLN